MISHLSWNKKYEIGIPEIDTQHQKWFAIFNEFCTAIKNNSQTAILESTLAQFIEYSSVHFSTEEKYMHDIRYSSYATHRKTHESFVVTTKYYLGLLKKNKENLAEEIWDFIKNWLVNHILIEDKKIKTFADAKRS